MVPKLRELNPLCVVSSATNLDENAIKSHSAVVITQPLPLTKLAELDNFCRSNSVSFFYCFSSGVSVDLFVDHGPNHTVFDFDGERPVQKLITDIIAINENESLIRYETPEGQQAISVSKGNYEISEVIGVESLNGRVIQVTRNFSDPVKTVRVPLPVAVGEKYVSGGLLTEKKLPTPYPMQSLIEKMYSPGDTFGEPPTLVSTDLINFGSELQQHVAFYAVATFTEDYKRLPYVNNSKDSEEVLQIAKNLIAEKKVDLPDFEIDEKFVKR